MKWWNRYMVETANVRIGLDLTDWALPVRISFGASNLWVQILCLDLDVYWGELH